MANPIVIDISHHQPDPIDWKAVKGGGTVGVILKATEAGFKDPTYTKRVAAARAEGLLTASYHFLRPSSKLSIEDQMANYIGVASPERGERMVIDFEDPASTLGELEQAVAFLLDHTKAEVTVYGSNVLVDACKGKKSQILSAYTSLWQARYSTTKQPPQPPAIWSTWSLWQYTDKAKVDGIKGPVDGNKWNGDEASLKRWFQRPAEPVTDHPPIDPSQPEKVYIDINVGPTPPDLRIAIRVNGKEVS